MDMPEFEKKTDSLADHLSKVAAKLSNDLGVPAVGILVAITKYKCAVYLGTNDECCSKLDVPDMCKGFAESLKKMGEEIKSGKVEAQECNEHTVLKSEVEVKKDPPVKRFDPPDLDQHKHSN